MPVHRSPYVVSQSGVYELVHKAQVYNVIKLRSQTCQHVCAYIFHFSTNYLRILKGHVAINQSWIEFQVK